MKIFDNWEYIYKNNKRKSKDKSKKIKVACLLAFYNGGKYIKEQLQSILNQKKLNFTITIFISDDLSKEQLPKLKDLKLINNDDCEILYRRSKKNFGYTINFLYSLQSLNDNFDYYCFADQDDIWNKDKIYKSLQILGGYPEKKPSLYFGRTNYYNEDCSIKIGSSLLFKRSPSFKNAIIQNMAGGNTMVFNKVAKKIIASFGDYAPASHDWWSYQIISGVGGNIFYDCEPSLKYRQHKSNTIGSNNELKDKLKRIKKIFSNELKDWNDKNIIALENQQHLLKENNRLILENFKLARKTFLLKRLFLFYSTGIYRQKKTGDVGFFLALLFNKI